jgi:hypothetical protein
MPRSRDLGARAGCVLLVGLDGCQVRLRGPCAFVCPRVPRVCPVCVPVIPAPLYFLPVTGAVH